jgi:UDP-N-acetyl-D-mannosaminouronate:lipid I N-acetyl-D-mannosaminouronosyltransferase
MTIISEKKIDGLSIKLYKSITVAVSDIFKNHMDSDYSAIAINPEKIISARENKAVREVLENSSIRYADGIGVVKFITYKYKTKISRIPGCELWIEVMKKAGNLNIPVYLVGSKNETLLTTVSKLKSLYETNIVGYQDGYFENEELVIKHILESKARIVTVALGSPRQELFIEKCRDSGIKAFFMGVGGTYDVFTGSVKRAPPIFCKLGLEWFYRALSQPSRIYRQRNLIKFLWLAMTNKL